MKQPHNPIPASILWKGAGAEGGNGGGGGGMVGVDEVEMEVEVNIFVCVSVKIGQNLMFHLFFSHNHQKSAIHVFCCYFQQGKFQLHRQRNGEMPGTALHI